jgi:cell wall-associated NlpC family hydrolase
MSVDVTASTFGGPNDPGTGHVGYRGDDLRGRPCFAELSSNYTAPLSHLDFSALGKALHNGQGGALPYRKLVRVTHGQTTMVLEKLDVGRGGAGGAGTSRAIDIWYEAAQVLGLNGLETVTVEEAHPGDVASMHPIRSSSATTTAGPSGDQLVREAAKYIGVRYTWGGADPRTGFDCSGLVWYCAHTLGVQVPRTTYEQITYGQKVWDKAQGGTPSHQIGDLAFFGTPANPHHVGIMQDGDTMIEAPHTGASVRISSWQRPDLLAVRRIMRAGTTMGPGAAASSAASGAAGAVAGAISDNAAAAASAVVGALKGPAITAGVYVVLFVVGIGLVLVALRHAAGGSVPPIPLPIPE